MDEQLWLQGNAIVPVADDVRITPEQIARFSDRQAVLYLTEFGGLPGYRAAKNIELGFGYRRAGERAQMDYALSVQLKINPATVFGPSIND